MGQQKCFAFVQPVRQYPSFKSKNHCSVRMVTKPTSVTTIQPMLLSTSRRTLDRKDLPRLRREKRTESLIASCNQSIEANEEYQTRIPFVRACRSSSLSV